MRQFHDMLLNIRIRGVDKQNRTGVDTRAIFGYQMRFDLSKGFPLVTTKFTSFKNIATELLWFLQGSPNINYLHSVGNHIWDEWAFPDGTFGPIYGYQWRTWPAADGTSIDQIANVINKLKSNPDDRRMIVSAWNVDAVESGAMALPPCHVLFHFFTRPPTTPDGKRKLDCLLYQRSCDTFLGVPYNVASYALLTHMIAHVVGMEPGDFVWTGGDVHIYKNHTEQVSELLRREPYPLPTLEINSEVTDIDDFVLEDFVLKGYKHDPAIKAPVAV